MNPADVQVVVMAGGIGTRLGQAGVSRPKVLQPVNGRPFVDILLTLLNAKGFRRFCFCLGYLAEQVVAHLERRWPQLALTYHVDDRPLGTGGSLIAASELLDETFLLVMGDTYLDIDYAGLLAGLSPPALGVMAVTDQVTDVPPNVQVSSGRVVRYDKAARVGASWVDTGALVLRRSALRPLGDVPAPADLGVVLTGLIGRRALLAFPVHTPFYDIGAPDRLNRFERSLEALAAEGFDQGEGEYAADHYRTEQAALGRQAWPGHGGQPSEYDSQADQGDPAADAGDS